MKKREVKVDKKIFVLITILLIMTVVIVFWIPKETEEGVCRVDSDCVKQQVTCCGCSMGGREECMTKFEATIWKEKLARECKEDVMCIALYNCKDTECKCEGGKCVEVEK